MKMMCKKPRMPVEEAPPCLHEGGRRAAKGRARGRRGEAGGGGRRPGSEVAEGIVSGSSSPFQSPLRSYQNFASESSRPGHVVGEGALPDSWANLLMILGTKSSRTFASFAFACSASPLHPCDCMNSNPPLLPASQTRTSERRFEDRSGGPAPGRLCLLSPPATTPDSQPHRVLIFRDTPPPQPNFQDPLTDDRAY